MLVCYLDDSGKDPQNRVTTVAGYLARDKAWQAFESEVEPIFKRRGVTILHAKDLESTKGEFAGWRVIQKQTFVAEISAVLSRYAMLGVSMSCVKETYDKRAKESTRKRTSRPYTFCMNVIIDWILRDIRTGRAAWNEGVALIVEAGHENNPEAEQNFHKIIEQHDLGAVLRSISFVSKEHSRAIQMADLFAFYTRRDSNALERSTRPGGKPHIPEQMLKIITEKGAFRGFVATDFEPQSHDLSQTPFHRLGIREPPY
ncbi:MULTISPECIES: DUF3800 domain-containing protein [unclassified Bradyrhizobium]|uniref:DUF3800 domain-containing protein n=1 Tax=unclassified Bradyrhizobium TaxID=2631580 RepID=UPI0028F098B0|nr:MULTISPECIES: DUF3800 domain-containing protein [unclassified Bradyrhizobium]